jgi:hypothetical protein
MGPLGGKWRSSVGKVREWYVASQHLQGYSPRLCQLRTDGLAFTSKYWTYRSHAGDMGPVSLVAGCQPKLVFSPLPYWLLWERSWVQTCGSDGHRAVDYVRSPSSQGHWICTIMLTTSWKIAMRWPREIRMVWDHTQTERGMRVVCWSGFPCRVYIDSNHHDSRIWVPLVCGSHHIDNLTNSMSLIVINVVLLNVLNCLQLLYD